MKKILLFLLAFSIYFFGEAQKLDKGAADRLVAKNSAAIGMSADELSNYIMSDAYSQDGIEHVYLTQSYKGLPVYNQIRVLAFRNDELLTSAGGFVSNMDKVSNGSATPSLKAERAIGAAFGALSLPAPSALKQQGILPKDGKLNFGIVPSVTENVTAELIWVPVEKGKEIQVKLAWEIQVVPQGSPDWWFVQVDANNGAVLAKYNRTHYDQWEKTPGAGILKARNTNAAKGSSVLNMLGTARGASPDVVFSANYLVIPYPYESPRHTSAAVVSDPWNNAPGNASTLGWHSNGTTDYTITRGNNVWATEDRAASNSNTGNPATSSTTTSPLNFNFPPNYNIDPTTPSFQNFAITNLFYWNNNMHDMMYQYGFTEVSRNYQANNLGRGGAQGDDVAALAQSGAGTNNANFLAGADGTRGRMRMYLFDPASLTILHVNSPGSIVGDYNAVESAFSGSNLLANVGPKTGQVVQFNNVENEACGPGSTPTNSLTGKIALINRGNCNFTEKVLNAQAAGAIAVIMVNNVAGNPIIMGGGPDNSIVIPAVMVSQGDGAILAAQIPNNLNVTLSAENTQSLDGDLDAGVMCHEYGHGVSNRLTGTGSGGCLSNAEEGGEGWSDYLGLMMTTNWSTALLTDGTKSRGVGTYVVGQLPSGGGIRNYPYSTNIAVNPLTYANMGTGTIGTEVHNIGEIWAMACWEMTWAIINQEGAINPNLWNYSPTSNGGNTIALKLVLEGMKLQPCSPGYIDARNAILAADRNLYAGKHACAIWTAFAKRGMGYPASQGSSNSATDQTASTVMPPAPTITTQPTAAPSVASGGSLTLTASAGADVNLIYQWQVSTNSGGTWNDVSPAVITPSLTINPVTCAMNGNQYRAIVRIGCLTTTTTVSTLTVTGCTSTPAITLTSAAGTNNQTVCVNTAITNIAYSTSGGVTGATVTGLPAGVTGTYAGGTNGTFTISGTPTAAGSFPYTVTTSGGTGPNATATGTIIVNANGTITLTSAAGTNNQAITLGSPIVNITYSTGGGVTGATVTGLPAGVTGTYSGGTNGTVTISGTPTATGTFSYTVTLSGACGTANATGTIIVSNGPSIVLTSAAGTNSQTVCINTAITNIVYTTGGGVTGASITAGALPAGVTGTYSGGTNGTFTISGTPTAAGTFSYTVTTSGGTGPAATATGTITVNANATVTLSSAAGTNNQTVCQGVAITNITYTTTGGATGATVTGLPAGVTSAFAGSTVTISGTPTASGTFNYTVTTTGGCGSATATGTITVNPGVTVTLTSAAGTNNQTKCINTAITNITYSTAGGATGATVTGLPAGVTGTYSGGTNGTVTISGTPTASGTFNYTVTTSGGCAPVTATGTIIVNPNATITLTSAAGTNSQTLCANNAITNIVYTVNAGVTGASITAGALPAGVTGTFAGSTFTISGTPTVAGTFNYTVSTSGGCGTATATGTITVNPATTITLTSAAATTSQTVCSGSAITNITYSTANGVTGATVTGLPAGVTGTYSGGTNGNVTISGTPTAVGTFNYTVTTSGGCGAATATGTITATGGPVITAQPVSITSCTTTATFSVTVTGAGLTYQWQVSTNGGGTWTNIPGQTASTITLTGLTPAQAANLYRVVITSACGSVTSNSVSAQVGTPPVVLLTAAPTTAYNPSQGGGVFASVSPPGNYTYQWKRDGQVLAVPPTTTAITAANGLLYNFGTYQVTVTEVGSGCSASSNTVTITDVERLRDHLFVWPNPARDVVNVSFYSSTPATQARTLTVYDSKGARVMTKDFSVVGIYGTMTLDISKFVSGTYMIMLTDASGKNVGSGSVVKY